MFEGIFRLLQELREATAGIASKHEKEMASLLNSYKNLYSKWLFELRSVICPCLVAFVGVEFKTKSIRGLLEIMISCICGCFGKLVARTSSMNYAMFLHFETLQV